MRTLVLPHSGRHILQVEGDFAEVAQEGEAYCAGGGIAVGGCVNQDIGNDGILATTNPYARPPEREPDISWSRMPESDKRFRKLYR